MNLAEARKMLKLNEGVRRRVYKDSLGIETIGVGFNLRRADAVTRATRHGLNHASLLSGAVALTDAQVDALLDEDIQEAATSLHQIAPGWSLLPEQAQLVLLDMRFQLGAAGIKGFKNTLAAISAKQWRKAAAGMRNSRAYTQTPVRWERNARILESL